MRKRATLALGLASVREEFPAQPCASFENASQFGFVPKILDCNLLRLRVDLFEPENGQLQRAVGIQLDPPTCHRGRGGTREDSA